MRAFCLLTVNEFSKPCNNTTPVSSWNAFTTEENISNITSCKKNLQRTSKVAHTHRPPPPPPPLSKHPEFGSPPPPPPPLSLDVIYVSFIFQFQLVPISYTLGRPFHLLLIVSIDVEKLVEFHILYFPLLLVWIGYSNFFTLRWLAWLI